MQMRPSSGNVFRVVGISGDEATNLKMRSDLMIRLSKLIETRGLTEAKAAEFFGVSVDTLIAMLGHAGVRVQIVVGRSSKVA